MFGGKNKLSCYLHLWSFEGNLQKYCGFVFIGIINQEALAFLAGISVVGLSKQKDNSLHLNVTLK
jgi:hypothetical protein